MNERRAKHSESRHGVVEKEAREYVVEQTRPYVVADVWFVDDDDLRKSIQRPRRDRMLYKDIRNHRDAGLFVCEVLAILVGAVADDKHSRQVVLHVKNGLPAKGRHTPVLWIDRE